MPFVNNRGIRIHYIVEGNGPPLVLQYGQFFPLEVWHELNYVSALKDTFKLIMVDARGQGQSDKPYDPDAYKIENMAQDILAVLDSLGLEKAHYLGYSSGGYLGFALARLAMDRFNSFILGGTFPSPSSDKSWNEEQIQALQKQTTAEFVAGLENYLLSQNFAPFSAEMKDSMLRHDIQALIAWLRGSIDWPGFEDTYRLISVPCLMYAGSDAAEHSKTEKAASEIQGAVFVSIPGGGHLEGGTWINDLLRHILMVTSHELPPVK